MSFFSKLFKSPAKRELKELLANVHKETEEELEPVNDIGRAILRAAANCRDSVKELIKAPNEDQRMGREALGI